MTFPMRNTDAERQVARTAYETLEPLHVVAYFNPHNNKAAHDLGIDPGAFYFGARAGVLGPTSAAVVTATFFNFNPVAVRAGWDQAVGAGLDKVMAARAAAVERTLTAAFGDLVTSPDVERLAARFQAIATQLDFSGRPLAAAWSAAPIPTSPVSALWQAIAVLREFRGDGHIAALVIAGLSPVEALIVHEAQHPDPNLKRRGMGKRMLLLTRGWSEQEWDAAAASLRSRGLIESANDGEQEVLSVSGTQLYDDMEVTTDDAAATAWNGVPDATELLTAARPFVKSVIDAGVLPGTTKRDSSQSAPQH